MLPKIERRDFLKLLGHSAVAAVTASIFGLSLAACKSQDLRTEIEILTWDSHDLVASQRTVYKLYDIYRDILDLRSWDQRLAESVGLGSQPSLRFLIDETAVQQRQPNFLNDIMAYSLNDDLILIYPEAFNNSNYKVALFDEFAHFHPPSRPVIFDHSQPIIAISDPMAINSQLLHIKNTSLTAKGFDINITLKREDSPTYSSQMFPYLDESCSHFFYENVLKALNITSPFTTGFERGTAFIRYINQLAHVDDKTFVEQYFSTNPQEWFKAINDNLQLKYDPNIRIHTILAQVALETALNLNIYNKNNDKVNITALCQQTIQDYIEYYNFLINYNHAEKNSSPL